VTQLFDAQPVSLLHSLPGAPLTHTPELVLEQ
jgi:hypothetical protein